MPGIGAKKRKKSSAVSIYVFVLVQQFDSTLEISDDELTLESLHALWKNGTARFCEYGVDYIDISIYRSLFHCLLG